MRGSSLESNLVMHTQELWCAWLYGYLPGASLTCGSNSCKTNSSLFLKNTQLAFLFLVFLVFIIFINMYLKVCESRNHRMIWVGRNIRGGQPYPLHRCHPSFDAAWGTAGLPGCKRTLLVMLSFFSHQYDLLILYGEIINSIISHC